MAEESFELRVKRLFGSNLFSSVPDSSFPSSSWSVAGGEVERRLWDRERGAGPDRDDDPCASAFDDRDACFNRSNRRRSAAGSKVRLENDLDDLGDDGGDDGDREEREIRSSIGLDPTLDREEEEDEYDRAAFYKEKAEDRVYMNEINDSGRYMSHNTVLEDLHDDSIDELQHRHKDPRADHFAASVRLNEDQKPAEGPLMTRQSVGKTDVKQSKLFTQSDANVKPILKKRESDQLDSKPKKRVRFDPQSKEEHEEGFVEPQDSPMLFQSEESNKIAEVLPKPKESSTVPDYIRNPSKYICYAMDSSDNDDEESNKRAFDDFQKLVRRSNPHQVLLDAGVELPKTVTFMPRRKSCDSTATEDKMVADSPMPALYTGIAAGERDEDELDEMDEDDDKDVTPAEKRFISRKEARQYRSKSSLNGATS